MQLSVWTYEGPPHIGAMRVATGMTDVHYLLHAPPRRLDVERGDIGQQRLGRAAASWCPPEEQTAFTARLAALTAKPKASARWPSMASAMATSSKACLRPNCRTKLAITTAATMTKKTQGRRFTRVKILSHISQRALHGDAASAGRSTRRAPGLPGALRHVAGRGFEPL